jgi:hypothetical protein
MQDEVLTDPAPVAARRDSAKPLLAVGLASFVLGALAVGAVAWTAGPSIARWLGYGPETSATPAVTVPVPVADPTLAQRGFDQRLAALEQRLSRIDLQATAASGNAARAEGLLIAFAARRMIDKGAPLGFLEEQLRVRFADAQPNAVATIIAASERPITLDQLIARLQAMEPELAKGRGEGGGWERIRREISNLFVIRHRSDPSPSPAARIDRALLYAREGKMDEAIAEVRRLNQTTSAANWVSSARRYQLVHQALDLIEATALIEPRRLNDETGRKVDQPSPVAGPTNP